MTRLLVGPFNRVEGDLEVRLEVAGGQVSQAWVNATMYRGFEQILQGKHPLDALVYVPRICGICSVTQSVAAARALAAACGVTPPPNGVLLTNLMLACENAADHLTHFYLFFMPDFSREVYADRAWHTQALQRFSTHSGEHARQAVAARQRWLQIMGTLGGKWPHTQSIVPGGSTRGISSSERYRLGAHVAEMRGFLERVLYAAPLEEVVALDSEAALAQWCIREPLRGDLRLFLAIAQDLGLENLGRGPDLTLSYGAFAQPDGSYTMAPGVWDGQSLHAPNIAQITEDARHAWLADGGSALPPSVGLTLPTMDKPEAYTWNKAPRLAGQVLETGALARQLADGQPLIRALWQRSRGNVLTRVLARSLELAQLVLLTEHTLRSIEPEASSCVDSRVPDHADVYGLCEAARGSLGHWLSIRDGRIANYQIIAPTSWNFSPRDRSGTPGALEAALVGAPVAEGDTTPVAVQHIVRSFDPCMVCTVH
ncbi:nickel-dependent hydrogenase large subunit [Rhodoferax fermentans]|uniref:HupV protein n=1 Tax=Rhodoferax fermentans TaxID=28066 RepID=A0A1T1AVB5_RHOFE|nr:nickel-dependent hydrogenase large subunit [Rhodoferax fermentans]MBK1682031.1 HupV protein [Rhodoferax fermentans]OOV08021.1 HupV protein [Rhodoferax fermentans]